MKRIKKEKITVNPEKIFEGGFLIGLIVAEVILSAWCINSIIILS